MRSLNVLRIGCIGVVERLCEVGLRQHIVARLCREQTSKQRMEHHTSRQVAWNRGESKRGEQSGGMSNSWVSGCGTALSESDVR